MAALLPWTLTLPADLQGFNVCIKQVSSFLSCHGRREVVVAWVFQQLAPIRRE